MSVTANRERGVSAEDVVCERWPFEPAAPAGDAVPEDFEAQISEKNGCIRALESEIEEVTAERDQLVERVEDLEREIERLQVAEELLEHLGRVVPIEIVEITHVE